MILKALYDHLTEATDVQGVDTSLFREPQIVHTHKVHSRNEARRLLRGRIGDAVFAARRPSNTNKHTAVTLRPIAINRDYETAGDIETAEAIIQVDVYARGHDSAVRSMIVGDLIRLIISGYSGGCWGGVPICGCSVERDGMLSESPPDSSEDWTHRYSFDIRVHYKQAAAVY